MSIKWTFGKNYIDKIWEITINYLDGWGLAYGGWLCIVIYGYREPMDVADE